MSRASTLRVAKKWFKKVHSKLSSEVMKETAQSMTAEQFYRSNNCEE